MDYLSSSAFMSLQLSHWIPKVQSAIDARRSTTRREPQVGVAVSASRACASHLGGRPGAVVTSVVTGDL